MPAKYHFILIVFLELTAREIQAFGGSLKSLTYDYCPDYLTFQITSTYDTPSNIPETTQALHFQSNNFHDDEINMTKLVLQMPSLLALTIEENHLTKIPDLMVFNSTLTYLNLASNKLDNVNLDSFSTFLNLVTLDLSENPIVMVSVTKHLSITYLNLKSTQLQSLDMNVFALLDNLVELNIGAEFVKNFTLPVLDGSVNIEILTIKNAKKIIDEFKWQNLSSVRNLVVDESDLNIVDLSDFEAFPNLQRLSLCENHVTTIVPMQPNRTFPNLMTLLVRNNQLGRTLNLTLFTSQTFPALKTFSLQDGTIEHLFIEEEHIFQKLIHLNLIKNAFKGILDFNIFSKNIFPKLDTLKLDDNAIESLVQSDTNSSMSVQTLQLGNNRITGMDWRFFIKATPHLVNLYLTENFITNIQFPGDGNYHPRLEYLDLSSNPLTSLSEYCVTDLQSPSGMFTLHLASTQLRCDACVTWFDMCPHVTVTGEPACGSPDAYKGETIISVLPFLPDIPCLSQTDISDDSAVFKKKSHVPTVNPTLSTTIMRGLQACALQSHLLKHSSFSYKSEENLCDIFKDEGGEFSLL